MLACEEKGGGMTTEQITKAWLDENGFDKFAWSYLDDGKRIIGVKKWRRIIDGWERWYDRPTFLERLCMCFQITGEIG